MYFDGSLNIDGAGAGVLFVSPSKEQLRYVLRIYFLASNNAAEYEACLHDLRIAVELGVNVSMSTETQLWSSTNSTRTGI